MCAGVGRGAHNFLPSAYELSVLHMDVSGLWILIEMW